MFAAVPIEAPAEKVFKGTNYNKLIFSVIALNTFIAIYALATRG